MLVCGVLMRGVGGTLWKRAVCLGRPVILSSWLFFSWVFLAYFAWFLVGRGERRKIGRNGTGPSVTESWETEICFYHKSVSDGRS